MLLCPNYLIVKLFEADIEAATGKPRSRRAKDIWDLWDLRYLCRRIHKVIQKISPTSDPKAMRLPRHLTCRSQSCMHVAAALSLRELKRAKTFQGKRQVLSPTCIWGPSYFRRAGHVHQYVAWCGLLG